MITVNDKWEKGYTQDKNEQLCVAYLDEKKDLKAILPLYLEDDLVDKMNALAEYCPPQYIPNNIYELERTLRTLYNNMVLAYTYKETAEFIEASKIVESETCKEFANALLDKCNEEVKLWASLHPLWMGHTHKGMKYSGQNPYNMYPSEAYSTPDMYNSVWPERQNIQGIAFGQSTFDIVSISESRVGKKAIEEENKRRKTETNKR